MIIRANLASSKFHGLFTWFLVSDDEELSLDYWVPVTASIAQYELHQCDSRDLNPGYQIGNLMS